MKPNSLSRRLFLCVTGALLALPCWASFARSENIPHSVTELWADFDPRKDSLEAEILKAWGAFAPGKPAVDYTVVKELKGAPDWQSVSVSLKELAATDPQITAPLANWRTVTELSISPCGEIVQGRKKIRVPGKAWQGPREIRNLRWEGGE